MIEIGGKPILWHILKTYSHHGINVFIERLWWTVKYENVYPEDYADGHALHRGLGRYFDYYNNERKHFELDNATPGEVFGCGADMR